MTVQMHGRTMSRELITQSSISAWSLSRTAFPIGAFYLTEILVGVTDLAVVGSLGTVPLAAVGLGKSIILSIMVVGFAILSIGAVIMAERPEKIICGQVLTASVVLSIPITLVAAIISWVSEPILNSGGYEEDLVAFFADYALVLVWALPPALLLSALKNVLNAYSQTGVIFWLSIAIVFGNALGSVVLVHGIGDWTGMGVAGAALATVIVNIAASMTLLKHVVRSRMVVFANPDARHIFKTVHEIAKLGWAAGAQQALESVLFIVVLYLLGMYSEKWLAAGVVVFAVMEVNYAASSAVGEVLSARLAEGRSVRRDMRPLLKLGMQLTGLTAVSVASLVALFADQTALLFSGPAAGAASLDLMASLLVWTAPLFLMDAWQIMFIHALRGLRRTVLPMALSTSSYWVIGIGGGILLSQTAAYGAVGIWIGFCLGLTSAALLLGAFAFREIGLQYDDANSLTADVSAE